MSVFSERIPGIPSAVGGAGRSVIGGDFELFPEALGSRRVPNNLTRGLTGTWTLSGRSAIVLVLNHLKKAGVRHIHLPAFLCRSILLAVKAAGFEWSFYPVDADLCARPDPPKGSAVFLIHYFGWLNEAAEALRAEAGNSFHLIEDASQALLSDWGSPADPARFVILSPRKFGPLPFGGWCNIRAEVEKPLADEEQFAWRSIAARLARGAYLGEEGGPIDPGVESFYLDVLRSVEEYLDAHPVGGALPEVVLDIMSCLDWPEIADRRRRNWKCLHNLLGQDFDGPCSSLSATVVPLGYVIRVRGRDRLRARMAERRIFCPVHWPLPEEVDAKRFPEAARLSGSLLTLPVDQRYDTSDMAFLAGALRQVPA